MSIEDVCTGFIDDVDGLRACIAVDMDSGLGLGEANRDDVEPEAASTAMRAAMELFRGKVTRQLAGVMSAYPSADDFVHEAQITATDHRKFMAPVPGWRDCMLIFVTDPSVSVGLGWMVLRQGCRQIAAALEAQEGAAPPLDDESSGTTESETLRAELALPRVPPVVTETAPEHADDKSIPEPRIEPVVRTGPRALFRS